MLEIGVLCTPESWYGRELLRCGAARGHAMRMLSFDSLAGRIGSDGLSWQAGDTPLDTLDAVIVRMMPVGSLEQVVFRMDALAQAETHGTLLVNSPKSMECAIDKFLTSCRLRAGGLPVPETIVCERSEQALAAFEALGGNVVVKPLFGSEGRGMLHVRETDMAVRVFRTLERLQSVAYIQRYVDHPGYDVRVLVLDGKPLGAIRRFAASGDFRTNISRDGRAEAFAADDPVLNCAVQAAEILGTVFAGVDLIHDRDGRWYVLEANAVPGWKGFQQATGVDVAASLVAWVEQRCRSDERR